MKTFKLLSFFMAILVSSAQFSQAISQEELDELAKVSSSIASELPAKIQDVRAHENAYGLVTTPPLAPDVKEKKLQLFALYLALTTDYDQLQADLGVWKMVKNYKNFPTTDEQKEIKKTCGSTVEIIDTSLKTFNKLYDDIQNTNLYETPFVETAKGFIERLETAKELLSKLPN